mmetsp:Transcript_92375/g.298549  ORF Transcript_92375/g.298549 Transcript_92375/m.298549 type:complete len:117 (+) Transcript_92375:156-506(+)
MGDAMTGGGETMEMREEIPAAPSSPRALAVKRGLDEVTEEPANKASRGPEGGGAVELTAEGAVVETSELGQDQQPEIADRAPSLVPDSLGGAEVSGTPSGIATGKASVTTALPASE